MPAARRAMLLGCITMLLVTADGHKITVCTGGACTASGAAALLECASILTSTEPQILVKATSCCSVCPRAQKVVVCASEGQDQPYSAVASDPLAAATALVTAAGLNAADASSLSEVYTDLVAARVADSAEEQVTRYASVVEAGTSLLEVPAHAPLEPEPLEWEATEWQQSLLSDGAEPLVLSESTANFEFGECGATLLLDAVADEGTLSGLWEDASGGSGAFALEMTADGRRFHGTLSDDADGTEQVWSGVRRPAGGSGAEAAPQRIAWLHEALLGRGRAQLKAGEHALALEDARAATRLCCRTASGWLLLAEVAEACGDGDTAQAARDEYQWLES